MMGKLKSRKFIMALLTAILVVVNDRFELGIGMESIYVVVGIIATYIVGQGVADHGNQGKKPDVVIAEGEQEGPNWETDTSQQDDVKELLS